MKKIIVTLVALLAFSGAANATTQTRTYNPTTGPKPCDWSPYSANVGIGNWVPNGIDYEGDLFCEGVAGISQQAVRLDLRSAGPLYDQHAWQTIETEIAQVPTAHIGVNIVNVYTHLFPASHYDACVNGCNLYDVRATYYVWHAGRLHTTSANTITIGLPYTP